MLLEIVFWCSANVIKYNFWLIKEVQKTQKTQKMKIIFKPRYKWGFLFAFI